MDLPKPREVIASMRSQEYRLTLRSCKEKGDELDGDELYELELLERLDSGEELHEDEVDKLDNL
jgi:hypothetical protein